MARMIGTQSVPPMKNVLTIGTWSYSNSGGHLSAARGNLNCCPTAWFPKRYPLAPGFAFHLTGSFSLTCWRPYPLSDDPYPQYKIALFDLSTPAATPKLVEADERISTGGLGFAPDGKAVAYPIRESGVDNLWLHPIGGPQGKQLTSFTSEQIFAFRWSPDGKSLALLRGHTDSDVVLIRESTQ